MPTTINQLWHVASSGLHSQQRRLEVISHNVANSNTVGFRASQAGFQAVIRDVTLNSEDAGLFEVAQPGDVIQEGMGTLLTQTTPLFAQGTLQHSGGPFHMGISGDGFFQVATPDGELLYTRTGDFQRDGEGRLVNSQGYFLSPVVTIPPEVIEVHVDSRGQIYGHTGEEGAEPVELGEIQLANFPNADGLLRVGDSAFAVSEASGEAEMAAPGEAGRGTLLNGFLENSNVDLGRQMVDMLRTQRTYSLSLRALHTADEIHRMANELLGG